MHHPPDPASIKAYGTDRARVLADQRAVREGRRPPRSSWLLARIQESGTVGVSTAELCALAEEHVPGLFRSKTQLREIVELLRKQRKVMLPGGRYICRSLYLVEKERRRKEFLASRERTVDTRGPKSRRF